MIVWANLLNRFWNSLGWAIILEDNYAKGASMQGNHAVTKLTERKRDVSIDTIRGIAIFIMLGANVLGYVTSCEYHPLWFDMVSSFAAPLFIIVSGYMVAVNSAKKHTSISYFLLRGGMLILTGALIDGLIWHFLPFASFDILYMMGLGIPVVFLLEKKSIRFKTGFVAAVLLITVILQIFWEYRPFPLEIKYLSPEADYSGYGVFNVLKAFLYDGWFPVFPWIALPVAGGILAHFRQKSANNLAGMKTLLAGFLLTLAGFVWLYLAYTSAYPFDELKKRAPYGELFYPATIPFLTGVVGVCLLVFALADRTANRVKWNPFVVFGQTSLFNYILHSAVIAYIVCPYFEENLQPLNAGWTVYALLVVISFLFSCAVMAMKKKLKTRSFLFNFYFGG
jgi:fucose 4-O-acetylase-like acetyltransferase